MTVAVSVALPPSRRICAYAKTAEEVGCRRVWVYDSPALYGDVWIAISQIVESTERIGVGSGVCVPSLRHPLVTASAIATIEGIAPGRLVAAFGTGFTARRAMGQKPMAWHSLRAYLKVLRGLLAGDVVEIDGAPVQMLHLPGWGPRRPIHTPLWTAPSGPKGLAVSRELGVPGILVNSLPSADDPPFEQRGLLMSGTVLDKGEDETTMRVIEAAGPWFVMKFHGTWEERPEMLDGIPGGRNWRSDIERLRPPLERHLAVHEGHISELTERDRVAISASGPGILISGWTGSPSAIRMRTKAAEIAGITELVYAPTGPEIESEIKKFVAAAIG